MLQRSFTLTLRQSSLNSVQVTCAVCQCSCGRVFRQNGLPTQQKRFLQPKPNQNPYARTRQLKELQKQKHAKEELEAIRHYQWLEDVHKKGGLRSSPDTAIEFLNGFAELAQKRRIKKSEGIGVEVEAFDQLIKDTQILKGDLHIISEMLLRDENRDHRDLGKKMVYTMTSWGDSLAVSRIMEEVLIQARTRPRVLKDPDLVTVRKRLTHMAATGWSWEPSIRFIPQVMEGRVEYALGNIDRAIELWTDSIAGAEALAASYREQAYLASSEPMDVRYADFISPWVELANACLLKGDGEKAKWAIGVGCKHDDPTSHYSAAMMEMNENEYGEHVATSSWLYHMTKAAGSGHVKAAHRLGYWYGSSGWKYIEDEPPDSLKPTPFDSYPPDAGAKDTKTSLWHRMGSAVGLKPQPADDAKRRLFLTAAFPATPYDRFNMALQWLEVGMGMMYAPSYLTAARLLLEKTLWPLANAPEAALKLKDERYTYASRVDYLANIKIERSENETEAEEQEIPNPGYDPERAKDLTREVLFAVQALQYRRRGLSRIATARSRGVNTVDWGDDDMGFREAYLSTIWPANISKWFRFPETREMYMVDNEGKLWDHELKIDLDVEARRICDENEWDIYDEEGGLMYRHGSKRV